LVSSSLSLIASILVDGGAFRDSDFLLFLLFILAMEDIMIILLVYDDALDESDAGPSFQLQSRAKNNNIP
jgi:hypothetical protein